MIRLFKRLMIALGRKGADPLIGGLTMAQRQSLDDGRARDEDHLGPPQGMFSGKDAADAILFALDIDDHYEMRDFLRGYSEGDTREWPEFKPDIVKPAGAQA